MMRLYRAAAVAFVVASMLAAATIFLAASVAAQEARTPEWLFNHAHFGEARAVLQKRLAANPNDADALAWMARVQLLARDSKGAIALAEKSMALAPKSVAGYLAFAEALGEEAENASMFRQVPMARRIKKALETAISIAPRNVDAIGGLMHYYELAPGIVGGSTSKADQMAAQVAAIDPVEGFMQAAWLAGNRKQGDRIEGLYLKALAADPNRADTRLSLASLYANNTAKQAEAETHAKAALALDPDRLGPYQVLAIVYARAKRWTDLDAILTQADRHHPSNPSAYYSAARNLQVTGADLPRAERYFRRYLAQPPEIAAPSHAAAHWQLGLVLEKAGRKDEARAEVQLAVRMDPSLEQAKKDLKRLSAS